MPERHDVHQPKRRGVGRRSFLQTSGGVATGIAVSTVPAAAVALGLPGAAAAKPAPLGARVHPTGDVPAQTAMAYVHDADKGHVTVVAGTVSRTYHDPILTQRLLAAARAQTA